MLVLTTAVPNIADATENLAMQTTRAMVRQKFPTVTQISTAELAGRLDDPTSAPLLLDVREPGEFEVSHLQGAYRASDLQSALALLEDTPQGQHIVVYCSVGYRSSKLATELIAAGYDNVQNLEGSIFSWANEGRPLYRDNSPVHQVHPYNWFWGRLLKPELRRR